MPDSKEWKPNGADDMRIETTRFGPVDIDESRLQPDDNGIFFWLQSVEAPDLAFVVTDPALWVPEYQATIRKEQMEELGITDMGDAQVLVIVNKREQSLTANLQGPIVINAANRRGMQLVLAEKKWSTRHELVQLAEQAAQKIA
jgi:flagellar assembly factor FliW